MYLFSFHIFSVPNTAPPTTPPAPMLSVSITSSGANTAGTSYSQVCSATVTGSTDTPTITWVGDGVEITTNSSRTLTFNPLSSSHAGTYTCRAAVGSGVQTIGWFKN